MEKTNFIMMAWGAGKETVESAPIKRYWGVAPFTVSGINPTKAQHNEWLGYEVNDEPTYVSTSDTGVKIANIAVCVKTIEEKCGIALPLKFFMSIRNEIRYNTNKTKVQVIDRFGNDAWVNEEELKAHSTMLTKNDGSKYQSSIDADYRPAYAGEVAFTAFVKLFLNIPNHRAYVNGAWIPNPNAKPEECEARFDEKDIKAMFNGDFSAIKNVIALQPTNKFKACVGVKTTDEGKQYQTVFTDMFINMRTTDYSKLAKEIKSRQDAGAYQNVEFIADDIKEYVVNPTSFGNTPADNPFGEAPAEPAWGFNS